MTPKSPFFSEEKRSQRRESLARVITRLKFNRKSRVAQSTAPPWTQEELAVLLPWAEEVRNKEISYYRACMSLSKELKGRTFEAIRKKIKNFVNYGVFR